jgi:hypothetical protein
MARIEMISRSNFPSVPPLRIDPNPCDRALCLAAARLRRDVARHAADWLGLVRRQGQIILKTRFCSLADEKARGGWRRWRSFRALASPRGRSWPSHGARATLQIVLIPYGARRGAFRGAAPAAGGHMLQNRPTHRPLGKPPGAQACCKHHAHTRVLKKAATTKRN